MTVRTVSRFPLAVALAVSFTFVSGSALADTLVAPAKLTEVPAKEGATFEQAFVDAYAVHAKQRVLVTRVDETSLPPADAVAEARRVGANEYVLLSFVGVDGSFLLRASRHKADGEVVFAVKTTAGSRDDAMKALDRIAEALAKEVSLESLEAKKPVSEAKSEPKVVPPTKAAESEEEEEAEEEKSEETGGVRERENIFGPKMGLFGLAADGANFSAMMALGFDARIEQNGYFIEAGGGFIVPTSNNNPIMVDVGGAYAEMGASAYLTRTDVGPYLGGGVLPRIIGVGTANGSNVYANLGVYAQAGVMFLRSRTMRVYFDGRVAVSVTEVNIPNTGGTHPIEYGGQFGIGW